MNVYEKYYRRSYNALSRLIDVYKDGYDRRIELEYRNNIIAASMSNSRLVQEEKLDLMFTITLALLGINKEAIERTGKISEYEKSLGNFTVRKLKNNSEDLNVYKTFDSKRTLNTDYDDWLSIFINPHTDTKNEDYLRRIRNALLHSNFWLDDSVITTPLIHLKTKSYYEAELISLDFQNYVSQYYGNLEGLGLTEKMFLYDIPQAKVQNREELVELLKAIRIKKINYDNIKTIEGETPEHFLMQQSVDGMVKNRQRLMNSFSSSKNFENFKTESIYLTDEEINQLVKYFEKTYGKYFYGFGWIAQGGLISTHIEYMYNSTGEISNWLNHFWYLLATSNSPYFNISFFDGDEYGVVSCYPSLMILKAYLLMYRLQCNDFAPVDYSKINLDLTNSDIVLSSDNLVNPVGTDNYFQDAVDKLKEEGFVSDESLIWNEVICEVIRNSLAHGNVLSYLAEDGETSMIKLTDVDKRHGTVRVIEMTLAKFEDFLNSEAFKPKYCYDLEDSLKRSLK